MRRTVAVLLLLAAACSKQETKQAVANAKASTKNAVSKVTDAISTPYGGKPDDAAARERERFDQQYRQLESFRAQQQLQQQQQQQAQAQQAAQPPSWFHFVTGQKETFKNLTADQINNAPVNAPITGDMKGPSVIRAQVYL